MKTTSGSFQDAASARFAFIFERYINIWFRPRKTSVYVQMQTVETFQQKWGTVSKSYDLSVLREL